MSIKRQNENMNVAGLSSSLEVTVPVSGVEKDPTGKNPHELGAKLDAGKVCVYQGAIGYFPRAIEQIAAVSTFGARKYAWKGWETVPDGVNRYSDALGRHLLQEACGDVYDRDSGLLHAAHGAWNALARLELLLRENDVKQNPETMGDLLQKIASA